MSTFRVGKAFDTSRICVGADAARAEALQVGEGVAVWRYDGRARPWELVCDRTMQPERFLPLPQHVQNTVRDAK